MDADASMTHETRCEHLNLALHLQGGARVLVGPFGEHFFSSRQVGMTHAESMRE